MPQCEISHQKKSLIKPFLKCKNIHQKNQFSQYENGSNKVKVANFGLNVIVPVHVGARPNKVTHIKTCTQIEHIQET